MIEVNKWLQNSKEIASQSGESLKAKFDYEIKLREKVVENFKEKNIAVTPELVEGTYRAVGQNPDDIESCYMGNVEILHEEGTWKATWSISGFVHHAYGMLVTPQILVFNYSYQDGDDETRVGLVAYTFLSETIVKGEWLEGGFPDKGMEELRKLGEDEDTNIDSHDANFGFSLN